MQIVRDFWRRVRSGPKVAVREDGQALVELAVSMTLLLLIALGAVEFARLEYTAVEVSNAARAAAQYAAMNGGATGDSTAITHAAQNDSYDLGTSVTSTLVSDSCVCSSDETTAVTCSANSCTNSQLMETVTVTTQATYSPLFSLGGLLPSSGVTLKGYSQQMVLP